jgi:ABC-type molybdate transport system ATPase subunit
MLVIAHVSTITTADQILVLHAGKVAESGSHEEPWPSKEDMRACGRSRSERSAAEEARVLKHKADKWRSEATGDAESASQSEDEVVVVAGGKSKRRRGH